MLLPRRSTTTTWRAIRSPPRQGAFVRDERIKAVESAASSLSSRSLDSAALATGPRLDTPAPLAMFVTTLFVQALLATAAFALPSSKERHEARVARRAGGLRQSLPRVSNETHPEYSSNWAGAVYNSAKVRWRCAVPLALSLTARHAGHVQERHRDVRRPDAQGAVGQQQPHRVLCVRVGRHRRRHLRQRHPPDRRRLQRRGRLRFVRWCAARASPLRRVLTRPLQPGTSGTPTTRTTSRASRSARATA